MILIGMIQNCVVKHEEYVITVDNLIIFNFIGKNLKKCCLFEQIFKIL